MNSPAAPKTVNVPCCFVRVRRQKPMDLTLQIAWGYVPGVYRIYLRVRVQNDAEAMMCWFYPALCGSYEPDEPDTWPKRSTLQSSNMEQKSHHPYIVRWCSHEKLPWQIIGRSPTSHSGCLNSMNHRIGWWENWNRKPLYLMVKTHGFPVKIFP